MLDALKAIDAKYTLGMVTSLACGVLLGWLFKRTQTQPDGKPHQTEKPKSPTMASETDSDSDDCDDEQDFKMVIVVRQDLKMGKGKVAAQCSHAAVGAYKKLFAKNKSLLKCWEYNGQPKVVVKCKDETELLALFHHARAIGLTANVIEDAGRTQISPGSKTVLGVGPGPESDVNKVTGHLKLL